MTKATRSSSPHKCQDSFTDTEYEDMERQVMDLSEYTATTRSEYTATTRSVAVSEELNDGPYTSTNDGRHYTSTNSSQLPLSLIPVDLSFIPKDTLSTYPMCADTVLQAHNIPTVTALSRDMDDGAEILERLVSYL